MPKNPTNIHKLPQNAFLVDAYPDVDPSADQGMLRATVDQLARGGIRLMVKMSG